MYCTECGTKSENGDIYCTECGKKLENKNLKKQFSFPIKSINKRHKIIASVIIIGLFFFISFFGMISYLTSAKFVAKNYIKTIVNKDISKMYQYLDIKGDTTFVNKQILKDILKEDKSLDVLTYQFVNISYSNDKKSATATFTYKVNGSNIEKTTRVPLIKKSSKKWLFFDDWDIDFSSLDSMILEKFQITVPKNSKVTYAGIKISDQYLDKDNSTEKSDVYLLSQVFTAKTKIQVEFPNGYKIDDEVIPNNYRKNYIANISLDKISKEEQEKVVKKIKDDIDIIYKGAISNSSFDDIKLSLKYDETVEENLKTMYNEFIEKIKSGLNQLTSIEFTNITLSSVELTEDGNLNFKFKANYKYNIKYNNVLGEEKNKESTSYNYMNIIYSVEKQNYRIVEISNLVDSFSRY